MNPKLNVETTYKCSGCNHLYDDYTRANACCELVECACGRMFRKLPAWINIDRTTCYDCAKQALLATYPRVTDEEYLAGDYMILYDDEFYDHPEDIDASEFGPDMPKLAQVCEPEQWSPDILGYIEDSLYEFFGEDLPGRPSIDDFDITIKIEPKPGTLTKRYCPVQKTIDISEYLNDQN